MRNNFMLSLAKLHELIVGTSDVDEERYQAENRGQKGIFGVDSRVEVATLTRLFEFARRHVAKFGFTHRSTDCFVGDAQPQE